MTNFCNAVIILKEADAATAWRPERCDRDELLHEIEAGLEVVEQPGLVGHRLHAVAASAQESSRVAVLVDTLVQDVGRIVLGRTRVPTKVRGIMAVEIIDVRPR